MRIVGHRDDVHRDVARAGVVLQPIEDVPAVKSRQVEIQRDRIGTMLAGHLQADVAAHRGQHAEVVFAPEIHQDARKRMIVLDDEQDPVAGLDALAIVVERVVVDRDVGGGERAVDGDARFDRHGGDALGRGQRRHVDRRQEQRERAAASDRAREPDLAAEQPRDFAADRQAEAGAAVLAAGRAVGLLERFEDDLVLVRRDADAGVFDLERDDVGRAIEAGMAQSSSRRWPARWSRSPSRSP